MSFDTETLQAQIPYYLAAAPDQKALINTLRDLSHGARSGYFITQSSDPFSKQMLQGDGWPKFHVFSWKDGLRREVRGIVLSNSCDVSADNPRPLPPQVTFAPIVKLSALEKRFKDAGLPPAGIESRLKSIRAQDVTTLFYLPADGILAEDYVALLDDVHSMPISVHRDQGINKLFTLSMAGFYLFVFKLSVHFCRLQECVNRQAS